MHLSLLIPRGGPQAYVGHLTFQKNFWSNQMKYPHLGEVISLKFKVQSHLDYPDLDYPDFFSGPNFVMNIY